MSLVTLMSLASATMKLCAVFYGDWLCQMEIVVMHGTQVWLKGFFTVLLAGSFYFALTGAAQAEKSDSEVLCETLDMCGLEWVKEKLQGLEELKERIFRRFSEPNQLEENELDDMSEKSSTVMPKRLTKAERQKLTLEQYYREKTEFYKQVKAIEDQLRSSVAADVAACRQAITARKEVEARSFCRRAEGKMRQCTLRIDMEVSMKAEKLEKEYDIRKRSGWLPEETNTRFDRLSCVLLFASIEDPAAMLSKAGLQIDRASCATHSRKAQEWARSGERPAYTRGLGIEGLPKFLDWIERECPTDMANDARKEVQAILSAKDDMQQQRERKKEEVQKHAGEVAGGDNMDDDGDVVLLRRDNDSSKSVLSQSLNSSAEEKSARAKIVATESANLGTTDSAGAAKAIELAAGVYKIYADQETKQLEARQRAAAEAEARAQQEQRRQEQQRLEQNIREQEALTRGREENMARAREQIREEERANQRAYQERNAREIAARREQLAREAEQQRIENKQRQERIDAIRKAKEEEDKYYAPLTCVTKVQKRYSNSNNTHECLQNNCGRPVEAHNDSQMWTVGAGACLTGKSWYPFACEKNDLFDRTRKMCKR